jgi:hypothetical protein
MQLPHLWVVKANEAVALAATQVIDEDVGVEDCAKLDEHLSKGLSIVREGQAMHSDLHTAAVASQACDNCGTAAD